MTPSIPASQLVSVIPGVLGAGGNPLSLNAVFLTPDPSVPVGTVMPFSDQQDVANWFGPASVEAARAGKYFSGFTNADSLPGTLIFAQDNTAAVAGYLRGLSLAGVPLSTIQALSGTLTFTVDGVSSVSAAIDLSSSTSFSNAAALITAGIAGGAPGNAATCSYDAQRAAFLITSPTTGPSSSVGFPTVDALATGLGLTSAAGAVLSPGAAIAVPATLMASIVALTQNWFTFAHIVEPVDATKELYAAWVQTTNDTYLYVASDSNVAALSANASSTFGAIVAAAADDGVVVNYDTTGGDISAFVCGMIGSIDFNETAGRITLAYKSQAGIAPQISGATQANNLIGNGYNFYGQYATPNQAFQFYQNGAIAGKWKWIDAYVNQRLINSALQLALMELLANTKSVPYNNQGYGLIRAACADPINTALAFGAIQPGVALSAAQAAEVNVAAGLKIDGVLSTVGYYLQILDPGAVVRGGRGSPKCTFWYTDGGSVQKINLASIDVQ
jgi:hypothetical protein